jgi:hypothetical protein
MTAFDSVTNNLWRLPIVCFAVVLIVFGITKQRFHPRVARRVLIAGVIELSVSLLSWASWELFIRNTSFGNRWAYSLFNLMLTIIGLAGYIALLSAVFLDRPQTQGYPQNFDPRFIDPRLMGQQMYPQPMNAQPMSPQPGATQWPGQPPQ